MNFTEGLCKKIPDLREFSEKEGDVIINSEIGSAIINNLNDDMKEENGDNQVTDIYADFGSEKALDPLTTAMNFLDYYNYLKGQVAGKLSLLKFEILICKF